MYSLLRQSGGSINAHVPVEAIIRTLPQKFKTKKVYNDNFSKLMKDLVTCGYVIKHKTRGGMTFQFSTFGRDYALQI